MNFWLVLVGSFIAAVSFFVGYMKSRFDYDDKEIETMNRHNEIRMIAKEQIAIYISDREWQKALKKDAKAEQLLTRMNK